jgi:hypothetical protein
VGNNGETLVADSSTSTGLRYTAGTVQSNPVLNSAFQVWQRGTTSADSAGSPYTADRWQLSRSSSSGATVTRQVTGDTTNLPFIQYCARVQRNSTTTGTNIIYFSQTFESANSIPFVGKTVTVSFYARSGANYSSASSALTTGLFSGTGTDQSIVSGFTGQATVGSVTSTLTTTWQRFSLTATVATTATQLAIVSNYSPSGTAGANDYYEITGVQLDIGSVALPFRTYAATIQGELAACQRYFQKSYLDSTAPGTASITQGSIMCAPDAVVSYKSFPNVIFPVQMRGGVTVTIYNPSTGTAGLAAGIRDTSANTNKAIFINNTNMTGFQSYVDNSSTNAGNQLMFHYTASSEL